MGYLNVVLSTLDVFLKHTTIGGLCNAGLASNRSGVVDYIHRIFILKC